jgi:glycosyltransferase involved in cell wall biosynthesis
MAGLRIAVAASVVTPVPASAGGSQQVVLDLAEGLARLGHQVAIFCVEGSTAPPGVELITVPLPADAQDALVMPGGAPPKPAPGVTAAFKELFDKVEQWRPDIISQHAFDPEPFELAEATGLPVLHTLHLPPLVDSVVEATYRLRPHQLAVVSESSKQDWQAEGVKIGWVLPNGIPDMPDIWANPFEIQPWALIAGRLSREKGIEHGVRAALLAGLTPLVVGADYDPNYWPDLSGAMLWPPLPRAELRELMVRSAVTILPVQWREPFGLVAAEAQLAGCPVAGYALGALLEVVTQGKGGFLAAPTGPPERMIPRLADAVEAALLLDRAEVRRQARLKFSMEKALREYVQAFGGVLVEERGLRPPSDRTQQRRSDPWEHSY